MHKPLPCFGIYCHDFWENKNPTAAEPRHAFINCTEYSTMAGSMDGWVDGWIADGQVDKPDLKRLQMFITSSWRVMKAQCC